MTPNVTIDEAARLREVARYSSLEIDRESELEEMLQILAAVSGTTMAAVSLVDAEREEILAGIGLEATEFPRDSFASHTIRRVGTFVIPDTTLDVRFAENEMVTGPLGVRFYAGAPLVTRGGFAIGALSVYGRLPSDLSRDQTGALLIFSRRIGRLLELHLNIAERERAEAALRLSELRLRALLEAVPDLMFRIDGAGRFIDYKASRMTDLFVPPEQFIGKTIPEVLPPDVAKTTAATTARALKTRSVESVEYALELSGETRHFEARIVADIADEVVAIIRDVTERVHATQELKQSEERFRRLAQATSEGVAIHEMGEILVVNSAFASLFGYAEEELIGMMATDLAAPESRELVRSNILAGVEEPYRAFGQHKDGSVFAAWISSKTVPYRGRKARVTAIRKLPES